MASFIRSCFLINKCYPQAKNATPWSLIIFLLIGLLFFFISTTLYAMNHLQDNAKVISQDMASKLEQELIAIDNQEGFHLEMIILPHFYDRNPDDVLKVYIEQLDKNAPDKDKKALLLIVLSNNLVVLRHSGSLDNVYTVNVSKEIIDNIKQSLKTNHYDEMARIGVAGMYHYFHQAFPTKAPEINKPANWKKLINISIFVAVLIIVIVLLTIQRKKKP